MHISSSGIRKLALALLAGGATMLPAMALSTSHFASKSKLATGKWVKIALPQSGVYELTYTQLKEMGFDSPQQVRVYGSGGNMLSEVLDGKTYDDLVKVPVTRQNNKICFYGNGPVAMTPVDQLSSSPRYTRQNNAYSTLGYYFLTEENSTEATVATAAVAENTATTVRSTSLDYYVHEKELQSPSSSGKDLLGETLNNANGTFDYELKGLKSGTPIVVNTCLAAACTASTYVRAYLHVDGSTDTLGYTLSSSKIYAPSSSFIYYNYASPSTAVTPKKYNEKGKLEVSLYSPNGSVTSSYLDYFIITYWHDNNITLGSHGQLRMGINNQADSDLIELAGNNGGNLVVWNIDDPASPVRYDCAVHATADATGTATQVYGFAPGIDKNWAQYVVFNPLDTLMQIAGWAPVENQNIHGASTPDMVIVTNKHFLDQAQRIAQMHYNEDHMQVLVLDQDQVFNEFSSGTPDAMALRLMNKMFYDRDKSKFRYMLLLGCGSYDNRGLSADKANRLITFETDCSNDENYSYVTDDFFGLLDDNSGYDISSDLLSIGVGRIPSATVAEAKTDVDKLVSYVVNPDYGVWRNNASFWADDTDLDDGLHPFQAEGVANMMTDSLATGMFMDKAYISMYYRGTLLAEPSASADKRILSAAGAKRHVVDMLEKGQYFATFVGHAGTTNFSRYGKLWIQSDVTSHLYEHLPIMTTACCDVARFDSNTRGIAEAMFHQVGGGAIAMLTSARDVYADGNDALNRAFINGMFSYRATGTMPRLGDAYKAAKRSFGTTSDHNKMSFLLLGDPAMKINYPKPHFKVQAVAGTSVATPAATVTVYPKQTFTVSAQVMKADGSAVDTGFNGDAYATLYSGKEVYDTITLRENRRSVERVIYYPRTVLSQVKGKVVNGQFTATLIVPDMADADGQNALIKVYAHNDGTAEMVNGDYAGLTIAANDPAHAVTDNAAPVIEAMYFNDEDTSPETDLIPSSSTLYIKANDDVAINTQDTSVGQSMSLMLDGTTSYTSVGNYATLSDNGRQLDIALPMHSLTSGRHTLTYTVYDIAGNHTSRTLSFVVGQASQASLSVQETPAVDKATFNIDSQLAQSPTVTLKVTDATGRLVWHKRVSTFPYTWDLAGDNGSRVAAGLYKCFGTYEAGNDYGGTPMCDLIVVDNYKRSK